MIPCDVMELAQDSDPDHPRKRFRGPCGHRVRAVQLDDGRGMQMSALAWWV